MKFLLTILISLLFTIVGCATSPAQPAQSQVEVRQAQTRHYNTLSYTEALRAVVATFMDLGFAIEEANYDMGTITGRRHWGYTMSMTVTVQQRDANQITVRANAREVRVSPNTFIRPFDFNHPQTYQDFFAVFDKAVFLTLNR
jgi:hypothetical protein